MPDVFTGRATAREQQAALLAGLKRERDGYASRKGNDKAHEMSWAERAAEVDDEIKRLEKEMDQEKVYSTLGRPEGPGADETRPQAETTSTEPPARQVPTAPVRRKPAPAGKPAASEKSA